MKKHPYIIIVIIIIILVIGVAIWKDRNSSLGKNSPINPSVNNPVNTSVGEIKNDKVVADAALFDAANQAIPPAKDEQALKTDFTYDISLDKIVGKKWEWVQTVNYDNTVFTPQKIGAFSVTFNKDGTLTGTTDCNSIFGKYVAKNGTITFSGMGATQMYCEGSEETKFTTYLGQVSGFKENGNENLVLGLQYDSGSMIFK